MAPHYLYPNFLRPEIPEEGLEDGVIDELEVRLVSLTITAYLVNSWSVARTLLGFQYGIRLQLFLDKAVFKQGCEDSSERR